MVVTPAFAGDEIVQPVENIEETTSPAEETTLDDVIRVAADLEAEGVAVYGSAITAAGERVLLTSEVEPGSRAEETVDQVLETEGVERRLELAGPARMVADTDVVGGAGYLGWLPDESGGGHCSIGFSAWTPAGDPALITAGHCSQDGALSDVALTLPSTQPANGGTDEADMTIETHDLGAFSFSQFGGPGNTSGAEGAENSVDIAIIEDINPALTLLPEVTDWSTADDDDLSLGTTLVTSVGQVADGVVTHSGRTTGSKSGQVFLLDGWLRVLGYGGDDDIRWVRGFAAEIDVNPGDSGGAVVQGETAVGVASAEAQLTDGTDIMWGAHLVSSLEQVPGDYEVMLHIDSPAVTSHAAGATVTTGTTLSGTAPFNAERVAVSFASGSGDAVEVSDGQWSVAVPSTPGTYTLTYSARAGTYNTSETETFAVTVVPAAPVITSPADGSTVAVPLEAISGTGLAGATLALTGDVVDDVVVAGDGTWTVPVDLGEGEYTITATQSLGGQTSAPASSMFTVAVLPLVITSVADGAEFVVGDAPAAISGTGQPGENVFFEFSKDGVVVSTDDSLVVAEDGSWSAPAFEPALEVGRYIVVVSYLDDEGEPAGEQTVVSFSVVPVPVDPTPTPTPDPAGNGGLAETGSSSPVMPYLGGALVLLLAGAGTLLAVRRRRA